MKVGGVPGNQPVKAKTSEQTTDKDKKFSALLEQKKKRSSTADPDAPDLGTKDAPAKDLANLPPTPGNLTGAALTPEALKQQPATQIAKPQESKAAAPSRMIEKLTDEITVATKASGVKEVQIQLNSKTLDGLQINISKQDGAVQVQFQTQSVQVAELLQAQTGQLVDRLAAKGLTVASVSVNRRPSDFRASGVRRRTEDDSIAGPRAHDTPGDNTPNKDQRR